MEAVSAEIRNRSERAWLHPKDNASDNKLFGAGRSFEIFKESITSRVISPTSLPFWDKIVIDKKHKHAKTDNHVLHNNRQNFNWNAP